MNVIIFGPPLAGKGTQSKKIIKEFNLNHLSTGDVLRAEKKEKTPLGIEAENYSKKGLLVPDELVSKVVEKFYLENKNKAGFLFDGYPRNLDQTKHLLNFLSSQKDEIHKIIFLKVKEETLFERAQKRAKEEGRKDDEDPQIVLTRIGEFKTLTVPSVIYLKEKGISTLEANGEDEIDNIYAQIQQYLK